MIIWSMLISPEGILLMVCVMCYYDIIEVDLTMIKKIMIKWLKSFWSDIRFEFPGSKIKRSLIFVLGLFIMLFVGLFFIGKRMVMFFIKIITYYQRKKKEEEKRIENKLSRMGIK